MNDGLPVGPLVAEPSPCELPGGATAGRNRDTAWFAMLDSDWPEIRKNFEAVLYDPACRESLTALNARLVKALPPRG